MTPFAGLLPSIEKGEPPNSQRWMAAQVLLIMLVIAHDSQYKHEDHND